MPGSIPGIFKNFPILQEFTQKLAPFHTEKLKLFNSARVCEVVLYIAANYISTRLMRLLEKFFGESLKMTDFTMEMSWFH